MKNFIAMENVEGRFVAVASSYLKAVEAILKRPEVEWAVENHQIPADEVERFRNGTSWGLIENEHWWHVEEHEVL